MSTRAALYDAALSLLDEFDYDDLTVEEICATAGLSRATFFRHFDRKASLLLEFNRRLAADAQKRLEKNEKKKTTTSAAQRLAIMQEAITDAWTDAHPGLRKLALDAMAAMETSGRKTHPELLDLTEEIVGAGLASGELASDLPPDLVGFLVVTSVAAAVGYWFEHDRLSLEKLTAAALDHCLRGLIAEPGGMAPAAAAQRDAT